MDNYYSVARVRALETRLLSSEQIARMAQAADFQAAFSALSETQYAGHQHALKHPFDFEELCKLELTALKDLLDHLAPGNEIIAALFKKYDNLTDKEYFAQLKQVLGQSPSPLLRSLVDAKIDLANIKTLLRSQDPRKHLLGPGRIDKDTLLSLAQKSPAEIAARLNFTPYFPAIAPGIEFYAKNRSFYLLEKLMDDHVIDQFKRAKCLISGIEPLAGFLLAKENEVRTIRFILICKKNYMESARIKERIRVSY